MFAKLAFRNVRRQLGNYLIYFVTVALMIALMFAMNNMTFCDMVQEFSKASDDFASALTIVTVFVTIITAFILGYATSFMLKLRRKEFGMYLTLGMTRRNILKLFSCESLFMYLAALIAGLITGVFLFQGLMALLSVLTEIEITFQAYSSTGLLLTVILAAVMFILASFTSMRYLKRVDIHELLQPEKLEKTVKHPTIWGAVALLGAAGIAWSFYKEFQSMHRMYSGVEGSADVILYLPILAFAVFITHMALSRSLMGIMLTRKRFCSRGTNTFTLRQLSGTMNTNAAMVGALSVLLTFAVILSNVSFSEKISNKRMLEKEVPFDVIARFSLNEKQGISMDEGEQIINKYNKIIRKQPYSVWENGYDNLFSLFKKSENDDRNDRFMPLSEFNMLSGMLGMPELELDNEFYIISNHYQEGYVNFDDYRLELNDRTYSYAGMSSEYPFFDYSYLLAVVPDEATTGMKQVSAYMAFDLENDSYDAKSLYNELLYDYTDSDGDTYPASDFQIKEYVRMQMNNSVGIIIMCMLYIATVFVCMALAMLSLKILSGLQEDRERYAVLRRLGTDLETEKRTLFRQTFTFFMMPFALPLICSIPAGFFCAFVYKLQGFNELIGAAVVNAGVIALSIAAIYLLYFVITFRIAKNNILYQRSERTGG